VPRFPLPERLRRQRGSSEPSDAPSTPTRRPIRRASSPGALRRERKAILKAREELLRDQFREDLLSEHARDIANLEARLHELDSMLAAAAAGRRTTGSRCDCGAPIIWGSHFCANCGRPVGEQAVVSCTRCGHPLPADAAFCPSCGQAAESGANGDRQPAADDGEKARVQPDRWEE
jgi:hypothetical protein